MPPLLPPEEQMGSEDRLYVRSHSGTIAEHFEILRQKDTDLQVSDLVSMGIWNLLSPNQPSQEPPGSNSRLGSPPLGRCDSGRWSSRRPRGLVRFSRGNCKAQGSPRTCVGPGFFQAASEQSLGPGCGRGRGGDWLVRRGGPRRGAPAAEPGTGVGGRLAQHRPSGT